MNRRRFLGTVAAAAASSLAPMELPSQSPALPELETIIDTHVQDKYHREIERCVKELKLVALKLHTIGHALNPLSEDGDFAFATAGHFGIPAMVHFHSPLCASRPPRSIQRLRSSWLTPKAESFPPRRRSLRRSAAISILKLRGASA
jgi:hypothetical protein